MVDPPREPTPTSLKVLLVVMVVILVLALAGLTLVGVVCDGDGFSCTG